MFYWFYLNADADCDHPAVTHKPLKQKDKIRWTLLPCSYTQYRVGSGLLGPLPNRKSSSLLKQYFKPVTVAHTVIPASWEAEARGS